MSPFIKSRRRRPILQAAALCELDGPRITGPITSLNILETAIRYFLANKYTV
jgi:hypothetical protein